MVSTNDLKNVYNSSGHPEVKKGKKNEDDVLTEFLETLDTFLDNNNN